MMDWTDRHCRTFLRLIAPDALLYTEMITTGAIIHGPRDRLLAFDPAEHPVAVQLGGSDPSDLAACTRIAAERGYDEINLNLGCPSDRTQKGRFGACLMAEPELVAECIAAMRGATDKPVTAKTRIGIDDLDGYGRLHRFIDGIVRAGADAVIIHARKALLQGLSPKENRDIPPLDYTTAYRLKADFPDVPVIVNGGIQTAGDVEAHLVHLDGVMIGREAYQNPWSLTDIQSAVFGRNEESRADVVHAMLPYIARETAAGEPLIRITRHMLGLYRGRPGGRHWRRTLSEAARAPEADAALVEEALVAVEAAATSQKTILA